MRAPLIDVARYGLGLISLTLLVGAVPPRDAATARYKQEVLVKGSAFHGIHGITTGPDGMLYAGSVVGQAIYKLDPRSGKVETYIPPPEGMADDLEFGPDGTLVWTSYRLGIVHARKGNEPIRVLATGLPGVNGLAFKEDGRLFVTQVYLGDALYEVDLSGAKPPRKILEHMGGLNGFDFGPDGKLYGPLVFKGQVVRVDVDSGTLEIVASGFKLQGPSAANFDPKGNLYVVDSALGDVVQVDVQSGVKKVVAKLKTALDNLDIDKHGRMVVTNMADNGVYEVNPATGKVRKIVEGALCIPGGLALWSDGGQDTLYVADVFAYRTVNAKTGAVKDVARANADVLERPMNAFANEKHVLLTSWMTNTVQLMDRHTGKSLELMQDFKAPLAAMELADGTILVAELDTGTLVKVSGEHGKDRTVVAKGLAGPVALSSAGANAVYVSEAHAGTVTHVDLLTGEKKAVATGLKLPEGLGVARDGRYLVVAEVGTQRLLRIDIASGAVEEIAGKLPIGLPAYQGAPPTFIPTGVAMSATGTIYMTSNIENAIYKFTPQ